MVCRQHAPLLKLLQAFIPESAMLRFEPSREHYYRGYRIATVCYTPLTIPDPTSDTHGTGPDRISPMCISVGKMTQN